MVRCPVCSSLDDKVVDSRQADDGGAIRRRRECLGCGRRFTTFERVDPLVGKAVLRGGAHAGRQLRQVERLTLSRPLHDDERSLLEAFERREPPAAPKALTTPADGATVVRLPRVDDLVVEARAHGAAHPCTVAI